ncbi:MAG: Fpg/Nei family DNA glycosylase [Chloroflexota bacterium]|nr:Fpg/Nei family DNA glycosylase [Chloroflexota bacterium]
MPEGDTIFQTAAALRPLLVGSTILAAHARTPGPAIDCVVGSHVTSVEPLGKHMLIRFDNGLALHTHLRMSGTWHRYAPGEPWKIPAWKARVVLEVPEHVVVCFNAPVAELMDERAVELHPALQSLGPDLLAADFSADLAFQRLKARPGLEVAEALLDQRAMAGVGNSFKSEILFAESVNPWTPVSALDDATLQRLIATARRLLLDNARPGHPQRVTTRGDASASGSLWVYGRLNLPCTRCRTRIQVRRQGHLNRPTYWCPHCQPG